MQNYRYVPGEDFRATDLYRAICETLIDDGTLTIEKKNSVYTWKINSNNPVKIKIKKDKSKLELTV